MLREFKGIVLRKMDYADTNQIIHVLTENSGKVAILAKGTKKVKSKLRGVTEPLTYVRFFCYKGNGMATLSEADIVSNFPELKSDFLLTTYGLYFLDLVSRSVEEEVCEKESFSVLISALDKLSRGVDPEILTFIMELYYLKKMGYEPQFKKCSVCDCTSNMHFFSLVSGGLLCTQCSNKSKEKGLFLVSKGALKVLSLLQSVTSANIGRVSVKDETKREIEKIIDLLIAEYIPYEIKSKRILEQIRHQFV